MAVQSLAYLLDTNILVHYIRRDTLAQQLEAVYSFSALELAPLISVVTEGEIGSLALQFGWGAPKRLRLKELLDRFITVPLDFRGLIESYARIDTHCRKAGVPMGQNDLWIAATAHVTGARLITTDKDFDRLDPLFFSRDWIDPKSSG
jgi:tRNA(fMet)-specific endonuclease VapC